MSMRSALILIVFMGCMSVWVESQRGNYPALNPTGCGLSRLSVENDSQCFEWHNNGVTTGQIRNGMNVSAGLVPWLVYVVVWIGAAIKFCAGSLISNEWVLANGRCIDFTGFDSKPVTIEIYSGHKFTFTEWYKNRNNPQSLAQWLKDNEIIAIKASNWSLHPNYTYRDPYHDLSLIKLDEPIPPSPLHNSICLPMEGYKEAVNTYVLVAGYGQIGDKTDTYKYPARVTYAKTLKSFSQSKIETISPVGAGDLCLGDDGAPIWQYFMGRAVLLGVQSMIPIGDLDQFKCLPKKARYNERVSYYIDWIIHETGLDEWHINQTGHKWFIP